MNSCQQQTSMTAYAREAISEAHYKGQQQPHEHCRIWSELTMDSHVPKVGSLVYNRIFVKGLPNEATVGDIHQVFAQYGHVLEIKMITDRGGRSKGYGFVTFDSPEEALAVLRCKSKIYVKRKDIIVGPAVRKPSRKLQAIANQYNRCNQNFSSVPVSLQHQHITAPIYFINPIPAVIPTQQFSSFYPTTNECINNMPTNVLKDSSSYAIDGLTHQYGTSYSSISPFHTNHCEEPTVSASIAAAQSMYSYQNTPIYTASDFNNSVALNPQAASTPMMPTRLSTPAADNSFPLHSSASSPYHQIGNNDCNTIYNQLDHRKFSESRRDSSLYSATTDESPCNAVVGSFSECDADLSQSRRNSALSLMENNPNIANNVLRGCSQLYEEYSRNTSYEYTPSIYGLLNNPVYSPQTPFNLTGAANILSPINPTNRYPAILYWAVPIAQQ